MLGRCEEMETRRDHLILASFSLVNGCGDIEWLRRRMRARSGTGSCHVLLCERVIPPWIIAFGRSWYDRSTQEHPSYRKTAKRSVARMSSWVTPGLTGA